MNVVSTPAGPGTAGGAGARRPRWPLRAARGLWALLKATFFATFRYRVTGLAAEVAFWALLSLPPLVLGLIGTLGYFRSALGADTITEIRDRVLDDATHVLTQRIVDSVVAPLLDSVLHGGGGGIISISFVISLWSGSRALNVYVDTITIAYGLNGIRGIIRTRALSFTMYVVGLLGGLIAIPLLLAGPTLVTRVIPGVSSLVVQIFYWPVLIVVCVLFLTLLYNVAVPVRTPWYRDLAGAGLALLIWLVGSAILRVYLNVSLSGVSIYGSLAAPIAVMFWLYVTAIAVLIGAMLNSELDRLWPNPVTRAAREARASTTQPLRVGATSLRSKHRRSQRRGMSADGPSDGAGSDGAESTGAGSNGAESDGGSSDDGPSGGGRPGSGGPLAGPPNG